jgi:two-component system, LytTR family, response regulator
MSEAGQKIRTLIVDDEPIARRNLRALLSEEPDIEITGECGSGQEAVRMVQVSPPDLIFLDVQMPRMNGFEVLHRLQGEPAAIVIFVTAFDQYALQAFEAQALDYLLKPFNDERFAAALRRAKAQIEQRRVCELSRTLVALLGDHQGAETDKPTEPKYQTEFLLKSFSRVFFLKAEEIDWIEAADYYARLHVGGKTHMLRQTMAELEMRLDPNLFLRIHRSTIVNLRRVKEVQVRQGGEYYAVLADGTPLKLSRNRREQLEVLLRQTMSLSLT